MLPRFSLNELKKEPAFRFLGLSLLFYLMWVFSYEYVLKPKTGLDESVIQHMVESSEWVYHRFDVPMESYIQPDSYKNRVGLQGYSGVQIGASCDGLPLMALFSIFILAFPGSWRRKLWFIPLGVIVLHMANVMRVVALVWIQADSPEWLEFNHDYTFTVLVYGLVFALWYLWTIWGNEGRSQPLPS